VLDLVYVIGILAVFALVGVIAGGVERLGPPAPRPAPARGTTSGEERR